MNSPRFGTIRARLLIAFVFIVLLPIMAIGAILVLSSSQGEYLQRVEQLKTVVDYKRSAAQDWLEAVKTEFKNGLVGTGLANDIRILLDQSVATQRNAEGREAYYRLRQHFQQMLTNTGQYDEVYFANPEGTILISTNTDQESHVIKDETYFRRGLRETYASPLSYSPLTRKTTLTVSQPMWDDSGKFLGVAVARVNMNKLENILNQTAGLGVTGKSYLVGQDKTLLVGQNVGLVGNMVNGENVQAALQNVPAEDQGGSSLAQPAADKQYGTYLNYRNIPVLSVSNWLPELQAALIADQDSSEAAQTSAAVLAVNASVALATLLIAVIASLSFTRTIAAPIAELAEVADQIAAGNLQQAPQYDRSDEIGQLAHAFASMTIQLSSLIGKLEQRVAERTREIERRTQFMEASNMVSQVTTSILDPNQLMWRAVELICERFDLYYVGLFLVDQNREWAVLRAGTGSAGQAMLARGHRLQVGGSSMIGWSIANAQARIALEALDDPVRLATAELPDTRSEAAIPLRSRNQVLGALTVQSSRPKAFDQAMLSVLQSMADQLAVAIDNARLFAESQAALETSRQAFGETSRAAWSELFAGKQDLGYQGTESGIAPIGEAWQPEMEQAFEQGSVIATEYGRASEASGKDDGTGKERYGLAVPIKVRGTVVGVLDTYKPGYAGSWTDEEIAMLELITEQLGVALDSARLYQETQQQAVRERLVSEITSRIRQSLDIDNILKTAAREIYQSLSLHDVSLQLGGTQIPSSSQQPAGTESEAARAAGPQTGHKRPGEVVSPGIKPAGPGQLPSNGSKNGS